MRSIFCREERQREAGISESQQPRQGKKITKKPLYNVHEKCNPIAYVMYVCTFVCTKNTLVMQVIPVIPVRQVRQLIPLIQVRQVRQALIITTVTLQYNTRFTSTTEHSPSHPPHADLVNTTAAQPPYHLTTLPPYHPIHPVLFPIRSITHSNHSLTLASRRA